MANAKKAKTSVDVQAEIEKLQQMLKDARKEERRLAAAEKAERERKERQREIDEALALGRKSRELSFGGIHVSEYLMMTDDERRTFTAEINEGMELIAAAKEAHFSSGKNVLVYLQELAAKRRASANGN